MPEFKSLFPKSMLISNLLYDCSNAFRDLHTVFGFDFCAPYGIYFFGGPYTVKKAMHLAELCGYNSGDFLVILTRDTARSQILCHRNLQAVSVNPSGKIDIDFRFPCLGEGGSLDNFCSKCAFDDARKKDHAETYLIWQNREYLKKPAEKKLDK